MSTRQGKRGIRTLLVGWLSPKTKYETIFWGIALAFILIPYSANAVLGAEACPPLGNINVPPGFELTTKHFQVRYTDGNTYWACLVLNNNISIDPDAPEPEFYYNHNRRFSWLVLKEDGSIEEDRAIFQDVALAAQAAFLAVTNANPEALREEAERYDNVLIATTVLEIVNAYGYIAGEAISTLLTGGSSEIIKKTAKEALKATAKDLLMLTAIKIANEHLTPEAAWKNVLRKKILSASMCLQDLATTDFSPVYGDVVEYAEAVDFHNRVLESWKDGRGGVFGLMVYHEDGLSDYIKNILMGIDPSGVIEITDDFLDELLNDPKTRRSLDFVSTWKDNVEMMRIGTIEGVELVQSAFILSADGPGHSLLAHWTFDEGSGSIASDSSGNGKDGMIHGAMWTAGWTGNALSFDGIDDWVDVPDDISPEHITLAAWIYPTGVYDIGDHGSPIFTKETGRGTPPWSESFAWRLRIAPHSHKLQMQCFTPTGTGGGSTVSDTALEMGNWYHVAGTYDGTRTKVYIDGNLEGSHTTSISDPLVTSGLPTGIGHLPNWSVQWFKGIIDEARIYSGALSNSEIKALVSEPDDTDGDGIPDHVEYATGTDPLDDDTDNDGLLDGPGSGEDVNANGIVDPGETDPLSADTDDDGIQDGTERGLVAPEGLDTDLAIFVPDADPGSTTDPTNPDTDGDGLLDGKEDLNGNGAVDYGESDPAAITGIIQIEPPVLNPASQGKWVSCYIELPTGYDVSEIDVGSLLLQNSLNAEWRPSEIGDYDDDGILDLIVKFDRQELIEILGAGEQIVVLTGQLADGTPLDGIDIIWVIH